LRAVLDAQIGALRHLFWECSIRPGALFRYQLEGSIAICHALSESG
jgi:hypothetical protein